MFNPIFGEQPNEVFLSRLRRLEQQLRGLTLSTREDFQAEVYSRLNAILALDLALGLAWRFKGEVTLLYVGR